MKFLSWVKSDDGAADDWTADRAQRATLLTYYGGDLDRARAEWRRWTGQRYARHLVATGRIVAGADRREGGAP